MSELEPEAIFLVESWGFLVGILELLQWANSANKMSLVG